MCTVSLFFRKTNDLVLGQTSKIIAIDWTFPGLANGDGGCDITLNRDALVEADAVLFVMKTCSKDDLPPPQLR